MKYNPKDDGVTHINVYSNGLTELGRFLSNFAKHPIVTEDGPFNSVEGYWYWLSTKDDHLRTLHGFEAKRYGRITGGEDWLDDAEFKRKICNAITTKLQTAPELVTSTLRFCGLPLAHYYVYQGKVIEPKSGKWIIKHIENYRKSLK